MTGAKRGSVVSLSSTKDGISGGFIVEEASPSADKASAANEANSSVISTVSDSSTKSASKSRVKRVSVVKGSYGVGTTGVGLFFLEEEDGLTVRSIVEGGSAWKDGHIRDGDIITRVDTTDVQGQDITLLRSLIIGEEGTWVNLFFKRPVSGGGHTEYSRRLQRGIGLTQKIEILQKEIQTLREENRQLSMQMQDADRRARGSSAENTKLQQQVTDLQLEIKSLKYTKETLEERIGHSQKYKSSELDRLQAIAKEQETRAKMEESRSQALLEENERLRSDLTGIEQRIRNLSRETDEKQQEIASLRQELNRVQGSNDRLNKHLESAPRQEMVDGMRDEMHDLKQRLAAADKALQEMRSKPSTDELVVRCETLQSRLDHAERNRDDALAGMRSLEEKLAQLDQDRMRAQQSAEATSEENEGFRRHIRILEQRHDADAQELESMQKNLLASEKEVKNSDANNGKLQIQIDALHAEIARLSDQLHRRDEDIRAERDLRSQDLSTHRDRETQLQNEANRATAQTRAIKQDLENAHNRIHSEAQRHDERVSELEDCLKKELERNRSLASQVDNNRQHWEAEMARVNEHLRASEARRRDAESQLESVRTQFSAIRNDCNSFANSDRAWRARDSEMKRRYTHSVEQFDMVLKHFQDMYVAQQELKAAINSDCPVAPSALGAISLRKSTDSIGSIEDDIRPAGSVQGSGTYMYATASSTTLGGKGTGKQDAPDKSASPGIPAAPQSTLA